MRQKYCKIILLDLARSIWYRSINALFTTGLAVACRPLLAEFAADELHDGLLAGVADSGIDSAHLNRSPSITSWSQLRWVILEARSDGHRKSLSQPLNQILCPQMRIAHQHARVIVACNGGHSSSLVSFWYPALPGHLGICCALGKDSSYRHCFKHLKRWWLWVGSNKTVTYWIINVFSTPPQ